MSRFASHSSTSATGFTSHMTSQKQRNNSKANTSVPTKIEVPRPRSAFSSSAPNKSNGISAVNEDLTTSPAPKAVFAQPEASADSSLSGGAFPATPFVHRDGSRNSGAISPQAWHSHRASSNKTKPSSGRTELPPSVQEVSPNRATRQPHQPQPPIPHRHHHHATTAPSTHQKFLNQQHYYPQQTRQFQPKPLHEIVSREVVASSPYGHLVCPSKALIPEALTSKMTADHTNNASASSPSPSHGDVAYALLNQSAVTFHTWEEIENHQYFEMEVLGRPSRLQPMEALDARRREDAKLDGMTIQEYQERYPLYGLHMGQFLRLEARIANFEAFNYLTIQLLADIADVTLYKCDFDKSSCCRVFLDGPQSYENVLYWNKRLRSTPMGIFVAHDEISASLLEQVYLDRIAPYHTIPITPMKTSFEQTARNKSSVAFATDGPRQPHNSRFLTPQHRDSFSSSTMTPPVVPQTMPAFSSFGSSTPPPTLSHYGHQVFRSAAHKEFELPTPVQDYDSYGNTPTPVAATAEASSTTTGHMMMHNVDETNILGSSVSNYPILREEKAATASSSTAPIVSSQAPPLDGCDKEVSSMLVEEDKKMMEGEEEDGDIMPASGYASDQETPMKPTRSSCSMY